MATAPPPAVQPEPPPPDLKILWTRLALFFAVIGVLGSLHMSLGMEPPLKACPLCYYQRAFIMAAAAVLAIGMFLPGVPTAAVKVLALAPAFAGAAISTYHTYLAATGALECPKGVTGVLAAPQEGLLVFVFLMAALLGDLFHRGQYVMQGIGAILLGFVFCTTGVRSTAPPPPTAKDAPLDGCRPPYKEMP